jgi:hypothetical protein
MSSYRKDKKSKKLIRLGDLSTELEIAEIQLEKLREVARERPLTLDETRQFDLLVKNIRLIRGDATAISGESKKLIADEAELLEIASTVPPEQEDGEKED